MLTILIMLITSATAAVVQMPAPRFVEASPSLPNYLQGAKNRASVTHTDVVFITSPSTASPTNLFQTSSRSKTSSRLQTSTRSRTSTRSTPTPSPKRSSTPISSAQITASASLPVKAGGNSCTPISICIDAITCGQRYGGCYDKNHCDGNTSPYPVPTCTANAGADLTKNNVVLERNDTKDGTAKAVVAHG
ncbi:hypothetical protein LTR15_002734 [Elasticomyces elasticus]|nr:hypothetical protein LTR15_002734 [Elasticomyces elasticus]